MTRFTWRLQPRIRSDVGVVGGPSDGTVSRGVLVGFEIATTCPGSVRPDPLVGQVDQALYNSKRSGRNKITHFLDRETFTG